MRNSYSADLEAAGNAVSDTTRRLRDLIQEARNARSDADDVPGDKIVLAYHRNRIAIDRFDRLARECVDKLPL
jgi:hypothetical protein